MTPFILSGYTLAPLILSLSKDKRVVRQAHHQRAYLLSVYALQPAKNRNTLGQVEAILDDSDRYTFPTGPGRR